MKKPPPPEAPPLRRVKNVPHPLKPTKNKGEMKRLFQRLFWTPVYSYRTSKSHYDLRDGERIVSIAMAYHNSHPPGMQTVYLIESVLYYKKPKP